MATIPETKSILNRYYGLPWVVIFVVFIAAGTFAYCEVQFSKFLFIVGLSAKEVDGIKIEMAQDWYPGIQTGDDTEFIDYPKLKLVKIERCSRTEYMNVYKIPIEKLQSSENLKGIRSITRSYRWGYAKILAAQEINPKRTEGLREVVWVNSGC